jgi:hypothetical protein
MPRRPFIGRNVTLYGTQIVAAAALCCRFSDARTPDVFAGSVASVTHYDVDLAQLDVNTVAARDSDGAFVVDDDGIGVRVTVVECEVVS